MWRVWMLWLGLSLSGISDAKQVMNIAGQEGDERFFNLVQAVYHEMGMTVTFQLVPAARALSLVNSGQFDAEVGRVPEMTGQYPNLFYSSEPLLDVQLVALVKKGSAIQLKTGQDLRPYRLGFLLGMSVAELYSNNYGLTAIAVPTHAQLARMLELNRLDVVLMGTAFSQSPVYDIAQSALVLTSAHVYHIFNQQHQQLAPQFDAILIQMKKDGRYQQLLNNTQP